MRGSDRRHGVTPNRAPCQETRGFSPAGGFFLLAEQYYSDGFPTYQTLVSYPGHHAVMPGKSQTYSVEADNAELRHYLARLGRRSCCFSRSIDALRRAVRDAEILIHPTTALL